MFSSLVLQRECQLERLSIVPPDGESMFYYNCLCTAEVRVDVTCVVFARTGIQAQTKPIDVSFYMHTMCITCNLW